MRTFTCAHCGGTFNTEVTEQERNDEALGIFEGTPLEEMESVCEDCWKELMLKTYGELE